MRQHICILVVFSLLLAPAAGLAAEPSRKRSSTPIQDAVSRHAVRLASTAMRSVQPPSTTPDDTSWPGRHPVLLGAVIGMGGGLIFTAATAHSVNGCVKSSDYTCTQYSVVLGGIGAAIGAGIGGLVALVR